MATKTREEILAKVGDYLTVEEAREIANECRAMLKEGIDPGPVVKQIKAEKRAKKKMK